MLAATCSAVGCKPDWIIWAVSRSSPSTVIVFATTRPWSSEVPFTSTLSPGISTALDSCSFSKPNRPFLSCVFVSSVRTTVTMFPLDFTINVSPVREVTIPLTLALSPLAPKAAANVTNNSAIRLATSVLRRISRLSFSHFLNSDRNVPKVLFSPLHLHFSLANELGCAPRTRWSGQSAHHATVKTASSRHPEFFDAPLHHGISQESAWIFKISTKGATASQLRQHLRSEPFATAITSRYDH